MRIIFTITLLITHLCATAAPEGTDYMLDSGDVIKVTVYEEPDLSMEERLRDTGVITYPFLGEIQAAGMTVKQLEDTISSGLRGDYLVEPRVTVSVIEYRPFYIYGEVEAPGGFPYTPGLTLRKAVALAGGFTERASRSKMFVIRANEKNNNTNVKIELDDAISPGDIVTIEQSFF